MSLSHPIFFNMLLINDNDSFHESAILERKTFESYFAFSLSMYCSHGNSFLEHNGGQWLFPSAVKEPKGAIGIVLIYSALRKYSAPLNFATFCHISGFKQRYKTVFFCEE